MKSTIAKVIIFSFLGLWTTKSWAQGCSDAGFCTMGAMKPDQDYHKRVQIRLKSLTISYYAGLTKFDDLISAYQAEFNFALSKKSSVQFKLPYLQVNGTLANTNGLGDITLSFSRNLVQKENYQINATIGTKIPTGQPTLTSSDNRPLPMYYQTTLGTFDIALGTSIITKKWLFATGLQYAFNKVDNEFLWGRWTGHEHDHLANKYPRANQLKRGTDIMARVERNFRFAKFNFNVGLLPIWRITPDKITMMNYEIESTGKPNEVQNRETGEILSFVTRKSTGLALTFLYGFGYNFSVKSALKFIGGQRVKRRDANGDGLSREQVFSFAYQYKF